MEIQIIQVVGVMLGVISPAAFIYALASGIKKVEWEESRKKSYWDLLLIGIIGWTLLVFMLTIGGYFEYVEGDILPRFLAGLGIPVTIMVLLQFRTSFNEIIDRIPLHILIGTQFFRLFGAVFFLVATSGLGPGDFMSSGYGDIITGLLAISTAIILYKRLSCSKLMVWIFSIVGLLDLLNVSRILLMYYPSWTATNPTTEAAGSFPLMLIVGITAPVALLLHIYTLRALFRISKISW